MQDGSRTQRVLHLTKLFLFTFLFLFSAVFSYGYASQCVTTGFFKTTCLAHEQQTSHLHLCKENIFGLPLCEVKSVDNPNKTICVNTFFGFKYCYDAPHSDNITG